MGGNVHELPTTKECDILAYVLGFLLKAVLKTVGCTVCATVLTGSLNNERSKVLKFEEFSNEERFTYPSDIATKFLVEYEKQLKELTLCNDTLFLLSPFKSVLLVLSSKCMWT